MDSKEQVGPEDERGGDDDAKVSPAAAAPAEDAHAAEASKVHGNVIHSARLAAEKEQKMTLLQGIRLYPKAVFWSMLISTCIVMEGFDIALVNNFCAASPFPLPSSLSVLVPNSLFDASFADWDLSPVCRCLPCIQQAVWPAALGWHLPGTCPVAIGSEQRKFTNSKIAFVLGC